MKIILLAGIILALNISAKNLDQILKSLQTSNTYKAHMQKSNSDIATQELFGANDAPYLKTSISNNATLDKNQDGLEYSLEISQDIFNPFMNKARDRSIQESIKAIKQETKYSLHIIEIDIILAYHNACISKEMKNKAHSLFKKQNKMYNQFTKSYKLGEISKKDLLFNKLDLKRSQQNMSAYKVEYLKELSTLRELADNMNIKNIICNDLFKPIKDIKLNLIKEHGELKTAEYKKNSAKSLYEVYSSPINSMQYEFVYQKEQNTNKFTFGLSIPLYGINSQKENLKAEQLALNLSLAYELDSLKSKIQNYTKLSIEKIAVLYDELKLLENEILPLNQELIDLSKLALLEGEGDIMEYIDSTRSYALNVIEMLKIKKSYYLELFELYKIADIQYGE